MRIKNTLAAVTALIIIMANAPCMAQVYKAQGGNTPTRNAGRFESLQMPCKLLSGTSEREYGIYLPGSYKSDTLRLYPVLYLLHGGGDSHTDWERRNHLSQLVDSLIGSGTIDDMIIVCPEANQGHMMYFNATTPDWRYEDYFFRELIPYIESHYRVRSDKGGRAVAGFSMGGGAATVYGVHHPEMFSMVYDISGYQRAQQLDFLRNDPSASWRQQVIDDNNPIVRIGRLSDDEVKSLRKVDWKVAVGDNDFTLEANMDLVKMLRERNVACAMYVDEGGHDMRWVSAVLGDVLKRADHNFEGIWIDNGRDRQIYGILSKPATKGARQPLAIISHGFNGNHHGGRAYFEALNALGYQVFSFDFPCGSVGSRSDNNTMNMSIYDEQSDLQAIVDFFKQQSDVDSDNIVLIGESQGGLVTALTAASMRNDIKAAVLVFPALCIPDDWNKRYPTVEEIPDTTRMWNVPLGRRYFLELRDMNVFKAIKPYKGPVLIVQGDKDPVVSMDDSRRAVKGYKKARLHVIPGAGHGFNPVQQQESLREITTFLNEVNGK